jgi:hypothetical protein
MKLLASFKFIVLVLAYAVSSPVLASGSYSVSGGDQANQSYNLGKSAFYRKLACSSCPLANQDIDETKAAELVKRLGDNAELAQKLSANERDAVITYLQRRYKLD